MFEKILSPLDGTPVGETGLAWAQQAASRCGASLELLTVIDNTLHEPNGNVEVAQTYLREQHDRIAAMGVPVTSEVAVGVLGDEIVSRASASELTVMTYPPGPWAFGGALDLLLQDVRNPVVVVRGQQGQPRSDINCAKVLAPIGDTPQSWGAIPTALKFCELMGASLVLCTVVTPPCGAYNKRNPPPEFAEIIDQAVLAGEALLEQASAELRRRGITTESLICLGEPAREIIAAAREVGAGLIAMATRGSGSLSRVMSSVALGVVQASPTPCLLVRPADRPAPDSATE